jgi:hypothetical protein
MNSLAQGSDSQRKEAFSETAARMGVSDAIVEKDFWVCWLLKQIFSIESLSDRLLFKGGTSLSKVYKAIERFSEDIDLAVDYAALGFVDERDPTAVGISRSRREKLLADMLTACQNYIAETLVPELQRRCIEVLGDSGAWRLQVSEADPHIVRFHYPAAGVQRQWYVRPEVLLEMGTHAEFVPRGSFTIQPFVAEQFPTLISEALVPVVALLAKRTFWEKVTILHAEYYRPIEKPLPGRYSRHYYDVAMLAQGAVKEEALSDLELLQQVVAHKMTFYPSAWARYDLAQLGTLRISPQKDRLSPLRQDYRDMATMIFGEPPGFDSILETLSDLESEIHRMAR